MWDANLSHMSREMLKFSCQVSYFIKIVFIQLLHYRITYNRPPSFDTFPSLSLGTNDTDYDLAQYVLSKLNCVTLNELKNYSILQQTNSPHDYGLTSFDPIDYNNHSDDDNVHLVARSLEYEILDNSFETSFATPAKGQHNDLY